VAGGPLYPGEIKSLDDYRKFTPRLYAITGMHVQDLLRAGVSAVLDFPVNTLKTRQWMRSIFEGANCRHELHVLDVSDEQCKDRLANRNLEGSHKYQVSDAVFELFTGYFVPPNASEGFNIVFHSRL
jgi:predicted kinase